MTGSCPIRRPTQTVTLVLFEPHRHSRRFEIEIVVTAEFCSPLLLAELIAAIVETDGRERNTADYELTQDPGSSLTQPVLILRRKEATLQLAEGE